MAFSDLIKEKDAAILHENECADAEMAAVQQLEEAMLSHQAATAATVAAHKEIHDVLVERGEHYLLGEDGTFTVYKASDVAPGYLPVQPIPGNSA